MQPITISRNLTTTKKYTSQFKKPQQNTYQRVEGGREKDQEKNINDKPKII